MHVTATNRLARELAWLHDREHIARGLESWPSAEVRPYGPWLVGLWREWLFSRRSGGELALLPKAAEQLLWEEVIAGFDRREASDIGASTETGGVLDLRRTAGVAMEAWSLAAEWSLPLNEAVYDASSGWRETPDTEVYLSWVRDFQRRLRSRGWITTAELPGFLAKRADAREVEVAGPVEFSGFLDRTPARGALIAALERSGVNTTESFVEGAGGATARSFRASDENDEVRRASLWARDQLERRIESGRPNVLGRIPVGIVVPDLAGYRSRIERSLTEIFHPETRLDPAADPHRVFNVSLGPPLSDHPAVVTALRLLGSDPDRIPIEDAGSLLRTPFLAGGRSEWSTRALIDEKLRARREPEVPVHLIQWLAANKSVRPCPDLVRVMSGWLRAYAAYAGDQVPSRWASAFAAILQATRWPGDSPIPSGLYQATGAWEELLRDFSGLDAVTGPIERARAVGILRRMARERQFQVEARRAPVQVLGLLEAIGMKFESLWVMGVHDGAWPRKANPNPFLPVSLQRRAGMPRSSPEIELESARKIERTLLGSAERTWVSFPARSGDLELRGSVFATALPEAGGDQTREWGPGYAEVLHRSADVQILVDAQAPPWDDRIAFGGASVISDQAACGFRSFAAHRLSARPLESAEPGLDARARGELVHRTLEAVWTRIRTHAELAALAGDETVELVQWAASLAIESMAARKQSLQDAPFASLERRRLTRIAVEWLELERRRAPFEVVAREDEEAVELGGVRLRLRPDRVDRLEDGSLVVIDYKTGDASPRRWFGDRPDEPQLPVYAATANRPVGGVYFGRLKAGQVAFRGIADTPEIVPGGERARLPMAETVEEWRHVLDRLGREFQNGDAAVDPKEPATCRHCPLPGLCRVDDAGRMATGDEREGA